MRLAMTPGPLSAFLGQFYYCHSNWESLLNAKSESIDRIAFAFAYVVETVSTSIGATRQLSPSFGGPTIRGQPERKVYRLCLLIITAQTDTRMTKINLNVRRECALRCRRLEYASSRPAEIEPIEPSDGGGVAIHTSRRFPEDSNLGTPS